MMANPEIPLSDQNKPVDFLLRTIAIAILYFFAAWAGLLYAVVGSTVTLVWLPSGIALAAVLFYGYRASLGILLGAFMANAWTGVSLFLSVEIAIGNTAEAALGAFLLTRVAGFDGAMSRPRDVFALIVLAGMVSTMVSAFMGVTAMLVANIIAVSEYLPTLIKWWLGDMMGVLVLTPPILAFVHHSRPGLSVRLSIEAVILFGSLLMVSYAIFSTRELAGHGYYPASLALFPFVIWGALRFNHWGASLVTLIISIMAIWGTTQGDGPFAVASPVDSLVRWCTFVNIVAVTGLLLSASSAEQRRMTLELQKSHNELERKVRERTLDLATMNEGLQKEMVKRRRLESDLIRLSEEQQKTIGRELHDGLGQHLTSIALFGAALQQKIAVYSQVEAEAAQRIVTMVNQSIDMTRSIARGLFPSALEFSGLSVALKELVDNTNALQSISCVFRAAPQMNVSDPLTAINLYRIAQEAINNAIKHSQGSLITVQLDNADGHDRLTISDNGIGLDVETLEHSQGLGMHSLRYRASLLGGTFSIEKNDWGGITLAIVYPSLAGKPSI